MGTQLEDLFDEVRTGDSALEFIPDAPLEGDTSGIPTGTIRSKTDKYRIEVVFERFLRNPEGVFRVVSYFSAHGYIDARTLAELSRVAGRCNHYMRRLEAQADLANQKVFGKTWR